MSNPESFPSQETEEDKIEQDLKTESQAERREDAKISIDFFFSAHSTREDFDKIRGLVQKADIVVPEIYGHTEKSERAFNLVSQGKISPSQFSEKLKSSAQGVLLEAIYNTKKPIVHARYPKN